jgi:Reverse transcriptase (RNA-dependent DNA polymerase)
MGKPSRLYTAFLDLHKAYDSVNRQHLWHTLRNSGVPAPFVQLIANVYATTTATLKLQGHLSTQHLHIQQGVRQGCPLSPLLFNFCLAGLAQHLQDNCHAAPCLCLGPNMPQIPCLIYADDIVLLATSPLQLQQYLDETHRYCAPYGLHISADKSYAVVYRPPAKAPSEQSDWTWTVPNTAATIPLQDHAVYLGVALHATHGRSFGIEQRAQLAMRAVAKVHNLLQQLNVGKQMALSLLLARHILRPALSYAAELTSLAHVDPRTPFPRTVCATERSYLAELRNFLRVAPSVARPILYREAAQQPLPADWLASACRLYNRMICSPSPIMNAAMRANLRADFEKTWSQDFRAALRAVGLPAVCEAITRFATIDVKAVVREFNVVYSTAWHAYVSNPADPACPHRAVSAYARYHESPDDTLDLPWYITHVHSYTRQTIFSQLRCACTRDLPVDNMRRHDCPYTQRLCTACHLVPGDYLHVLFGCNHPDMRRIRDSYTWPPHADCRHLAWDINWAPIYFHYVAVCLATYNHIATDVSDGLRAG